MSRRPSTQAGFGLVELMVALVLGLVLVLGVVQLFLSNQQTFRTNEALARLQENGRVAFEFMARELRQSGGNPCGAGLVANVLNNAGSTWYTDWDGGAVRGFDGGQVATGVVATGTLAGQRTAGTDAVVVLGAALDSGAVITNHNAPAATLQVQTVNHGIDDDDIVLVCDPQSAAITQVTQAQPGINANIVHNTGAGTPGNCSKGLGFPTLCTATGNEKSFENGGFVSKLSASFWYVGTNPRGGRSLYRMGPDGASEIADNVVDLQISYLLRDTLSGNLGVDWVAATAVTDWSLLGAVQPVAVRLRLVLQSATAVGTNGQPLRREQVHVLSLRNRAI